MSTAATDYEHLLSEAINKAKANAPRATHDLLRLSASATKAVDSVTRGAATLDLVPMNQDTGATPMYQLQLRRVGSEAPPSDLGVFSLGPAGYPVLRWYSRRSWEAHPDRPDATFHSADELEGHFRWLVSNPESRLVILVLYLQQYLSSEAPSAPEPT